MQHFGERLRRLRAGRPQKEIAADLGLPQTTLSNLENRQTAPRGEVVDRLAKYFRVPAAYFYGSDTTPPNGSASSPAAREWLHGRKEMAKTAKFTSATHSPIQLDEESKIAIAKTVVEAYNKEHGHTEKI